VFRFTTAAFVYLRCLRQALPFATAASIALPVAAMAQRSRADSSRADSSRADSTRADSMARAARLPEARQLPGVMVRERAAAGSVRAMPDVGGPVLGGVLLATGAKSEIVQVGGSTANLAEKTGRQLFAQVPGVFVYDMDGGGNQLNIATRGLDPHRSWEINVRQDGVLVNSDLYGYPASHYSPALEGVERVALVRGTAALQYGSQFGGVIDFVTRVPDTTRSAAFESRSTVGSYGLVSSYNSIGGGTGAPGAGRLTYMISASARRSDGFRRNSESEYDAELARVTYHVSPTLGIRAQVGRSAYTYQIPGPLTDAMFAADPRASTRSRNFFRPVITVPSLTTTWSPSSATRVVVQLSAVLGRRNSVQVPGFATSPDLPDPVTGAYSARQVDVDRFGSTTSELRVIHAYSLFGRPQTLAAGASLSANRMRRLGVGRGTTGDDYDLTLTSDFARNVTFTSRAVGVYAEQSVQITPRWAVVPGIRLERGATRMAGRLSYYDPTDVPRRVEHDYPLLGVRTTYRTGSAVRATEWYGGWAQSYRPQILKDLLPESAIERTDPNIRDARGWTFDAGMRGSWHGVGYDVGVYEVQVDNRFGTVIRTDEVTSQPYVYKTNVGATRTRGIELRLDAPVALLSGEGRAAVRAFTAAAFTDATYREGSIVDGGVGGTNRPLRGNRVEGVPRWIVRGGLVASGAVTRERPWTATLLTSHSTASFADPLNTMIPTANGARGRVPGYTLVDVDGNLSITRWLRVGAGISNALDVHYFTKRPTFYPGPGVWPSDGRTLRLVVELTS